MKQCGCRLDVVSKLYIAHKIHHVALYYAASYLSRFLFSIIVVLLLLLCLFCVIIKAESKLLKIATIYAA